MEKSPSCQTGIEEVTSMVIASAIEVHRTLGPGLLESIYEECLADECASRGLTVRRQVLIPVVYKGRTLGASYRMDLVVNDVVVVEVKAVELVLGVHKAQVLTYMKLARIPAGLLLNFHVPILKEGITRLSL